MKSKMPLYGASHRRLKMSKDAPKIQDPERHIEKQRHERDNEAKRKKRKKIESGTKKGIYRDNERKERPF